MGDEWSIYYKVYGVVTCFVLEVPDYKSEMLIYLHTGMAKSQLTNLYMWKKVQNFGKTHFFVQFYSLCSK